MHNDRSESSFAKDEFRFTPDDRESGPRLLAGKAEIRALIELKRSW